MLKRDGERLLPYGAGALFDLAADMEQYPRYLTGWVSARIYARGAGICYAEQVVGFGWARIQFLSQARLSRPERIEVTSSDARFRHFHLLWAFRSAPERSCRVTLSVELELRSRWLQGWLNRLAPPASDVLVAFERHAREILGPVALSNESRDQ